MAFTHKKLCIIDYLTGTIIDEKNLSENFKFRKNDEYALFYRIKRNLSYLYDIKSKHIIELGNNIKYDISILKLLSSTNKIYIFNFLGAGEKQKCGVIIYDINNNKYVEETYGKFSAIGYQYLDYIDFPLDESVEINYDDYGKMIRSIFLKYGIFLAFY